MQQDGSVRISELSAQTAVPVATLKYYLREGVLQPGEARSATNAEYGAAHLDRVRLIRALVETAGLSIAAVRQVTAALDEAPATRGELLRIAAQALPTPHAEHPVTPTVRNLVAALGWDVPAEHGALRSLSAAIDAGRSAGVAFPFEMLLGYARGALEVAKLDVSAVRDVEPAEALRLVVAGTVLGEPVLAALRRAAQAHVARSLPATENSAQTEVVRSV
jgi:DNA-binding transcriptional MerR regulator